MAMAKAMAKTMAKAMAMDKAMAMAKAAIPNKIRFEPGGSWFEIGNATPQTAKQNKTTSISGQGGGWVQILLPGGAEQTKTNDHQKGTAWHNTAVWGRALVLLFVFLVER